MQDGPVAGMRRVWGREMSSGGNIAPIRAYTQYPLVESGATLLQKCDR